MPDISFDYKSFLKTVPNRPGSYRMYADEQTVIYVGKAADLKKRLSSYFLKQVGAKTAALIRHIHHIEFTVTFSEAEALILENELIKKYRPHYNILLRDDKSYPYLLLTHEEYPSLYFHRGPRRRSGDYFGPYPDVSAVRESMKLMQKIFPIRQCSDNVFKHRSRACLMAQMGKCLAPCVPMSVQKAQEYSLQVENVRMFLKGQDQELLNGLGKRMEELSSELRFEEAAKIRDQVFALRKVQEQNSISGDLMFDIDVLGAAVKEGMSCVHVLFIRHGRIMGTRSYYPEIQNGDDENDVLEAFLNQFYLSEALGEMYPKEIVVPLPADRDPSVFKEALRKVSGREVKLVNSVRGERSKYLRLALENAQASLQSRISSKLTADKRIRGLEKLLGLKEIAHMECFDISHTMGELTVASCVSFNREGPDKQRYRRFNIDGITPGDDFAAMHQVLTRRFKNPDDALVPDLVFIDGGRGQLHQAEEVIDELFEKASVRAPLLVAVAKGEGRKEGLETLIRGYTHEEYHLSLEDPALQLILHIRDESHRFAITGHRGRRLKARVHSPLENIAGVGPKRRRALLERFGGMRDLVRAGVDEIKKVPGFSQELAQSVYDALHSL